MVLWTLVCALDQQSQAWNGRGHPESRLHRLPASGVQHQHRCLTHRLAVLSRWARSSAYCFPCQPGPLRCPGIACRPQLRWLVATTELVCSRVKHRSPDVFFAKFLPRRKIGHKSIMPALRRTVPCPAHHTHPEISHSPRIPCSAPQGLLISFPQILLDLSARTWHCVWRNRIHIEPHPVR